MEKVKRSTRTIIKRLLAPIGQITYPAKGLVPILARALFDVYIIFLFKRVGDIIESGQFGSLEPLMIEFVIVLLAVIVCKVIAIGRWRPDIPHKLRRVLMRKKLTLYAKLDNTAVEKIGSGKMIDLLSKGVQNREAAIIDLYDYLPSLVIKLAVVLYFLLSMHRTYAVGFLALFIALEGLVVYLNTFVLEMRNERKEVDMSRMRFFVRYLTSKFEILQSQKSEQEVNYSDELIVKRRDISRKINVYLRLMFNIPVLTVQLLSLLAVYYVWSSGLDGTFSLGIFTGLVAVIGYLTELMVGATDKFKNITRNFTHIEKLWNLFDTTPRIEGYEDGDKFVYKKGDIELQGINFTYADGNEVLDGFSCTMMGSKKTAFVGVSGSGKSTLVKLISGYIRPDGGKILIDGQDLRDVSLASYYKNIGYLTQEPSVFDGTIRDNLTYAISDKVTDKQLEKCVQLAQCDFIYDLKDGLDTEIGERGVRLSGGQRQRLAIAKIFLKDPRILILDEPTSALDSFSEEAITKAMHTLFEGRTVLIIAHRLQTVKEADDIIVLESGTIVERGDHDKLVASGGVYAKMLELQSGF